MVQELNPFELVPLTFRAGRRCHVNDAICFLAKSESDNGNSLWTLAKDFYLRAYS